LLGAIEPKAFKKLIVDLRFKLLDELVEFFPFYTEKSKIVQDLNKFTESSSNNQAEIQIRDELLTEVGLRLNSIYIKLNENNGGIGNSSSNAELNFVVDGANVALAIKTDDSKAKLSNIQLLANKLDSLGIKSYVILCDKSLQHRINDKNEYFEYVKNNEIIETPAGTQADPFILQYARKKDAYIITNDRYKDHYDRYGEAWIKEKRISFTIIDNNIFFEKVIQSDT